MRAFFLSLIFLFACPLALALEGDLPIYELSTTRGDLTMTFQFRPNDLKRSLVQSGYGIKTKTITLTPTNQAQLSQDFKTLLSMPSNDPNLCPRSAIVLRYLEGKSESRAVGCLGSKTKVAQKLNVLVQALDLLFL